MKIHKLVAPVVFIHILTLSVCFLILMRIFEFPEILRIPSAHRLMLFINSMEIIRTIYYALTLTGFSQIIVSTLLHEALGRRNALLNLATIFGILAGVFQAMGFVRWVVLIPFLVDALRGAGVDSSLESTVLLLEGVANRYSGMAVGEHLGFLAQAVWVGLLGEFLRRVEGYALLGWLGIAIGAMTILVSLEALGEPFANLAVLASPVITAWSIWLMWLAVHLFRHPIMDSLEVCIE